MRETHYQRNQKDTIFRMLFREKENALDLYNALNKTAYTDVDKLEITTLENTVYMKFKNDVSFVFGFELMLYEHQSTVNPNMPLRDLIYVTDLLKGRISTDDLYKSSLIKLPVPRFVVFYNGTEPQPEEQTLRLSDAYEKRTGGPELELTVKVYNVNLGHNPELLEACSLLKEYAQYVERVRKYTAEGLTFAEAVEQAIDDCIRDGILADFLSKNRAEATAVCIYEYNEELHLKNVRNEGIQQGIQYGIEQGEEQKLIELICRKVKKGKTLPVIAEELEEEASDISPIYEAVLAGAPDYDCGKIYASLHAGPHNGSK
ncbi:MAG: hypothetical protein NC429_16135 [Lachnospiraceae bacterium]|nr:hypothetical protein [Lachnospiraceae bacterium]